MARSWDSLMGGIRYGFKPFYILQIEGITVMPVELTTSPHSPGAPIAPTGYDLDASLVIDDSARIGSVPDERNHLSKGFDLTVRLLDTAAIQALMERPTLMTTMTADINATTETIPVESARGWDNLPKPNLYYGLSCAETSWGYLSDEFNGVQRGDYGPGRSYKAGTQVTDRPRVWKGRRVALYVALLDPLGRVVQGADVLTDACMVWAGHVHSRPEREGTTWSIVCRDQVRRLTQPLGIAASGKAVWELEDDHALYVPQQMSVAVRIEILGAGAVCDIVALPFAGVTDRIPRSQIRQLIVDALTAAYIDYAPAPIGAVLSFGWECIRIDAPSGGIKRRWQLIAHVDTDSSIGANITGIIYFKVQLSGGTNTGLFVPGNGVIETYTLDSADVITRSPLFQETFIDNASLSITLEDGVYSRIPDAGWVLLEADGKADYYRYLSREQDARDYQKVLLELSAEASTGPNLQMLAAAELAGELAEVSAKFLWRDTGHVADIMRRSIASSGDGTNGAWDDLPRGQGYDLPYVDTTSFDSVFDGAFADLDFDLAVEGGSSFAELFGGLLRLSQRAIITRRSTSAGVSVDIAAISVGSPDAYPVATITDETLVAIDGRRPVRRISVFHGPNAIAVTVHRLPVGELPASEGELEYDDEHLTDWTAERWELDVHGLPRSALEIPGSAWARAWFRGGENRQIVEIDLPPWFTGQGGDIIALDIQDPTLFDYAVGKAGLTGLGRVLGTLFSLTTGVITAVVQVDGVNTPGPMSPSIPIAAVNGTASSPTSIDVDDSYLALLQYAKGAASSWKLLAYLPGQDGGRAEYTVSTITEPGGGVARLTVTAYPSSPAVTLSTSYRLTWPIEDNSTTEQNRFLHTSQRVQWS